MSAQPQLDMNPPSVATKAQNRAWCFAIFAIFAVCGFSISNWLSRVPSVRDYLGATSGEMGIIYLGVAVGSIIGLICAGHVVTLLGPRKTIVLFMSICVLGLPAAALATYAHSIPLIFASLAFFGIGFSTCDVAMNVSGAANERVMGRTLMPVFHALFSAGTVLGIGVGALAEIIGMSVLLHLSIVAALVITVVLVSVRFIPRDDVLPAPEAEPEEGPEVSENSHLGWKARLGVWTKKRTLLIGVIALGMALAEGAAGDWLPLAMIDGHGLENATGASVLGIFLVAMTAGRISGVFLLDRFGRVPVLVVCAGLAAIGLATVIFAPLPGLAIVGVVFWGLGASLGFPVAMSAAADDPKSAAATVSAVATIGYLAFLVGPPVVGFLGDHFGLLNALIFVLALVVAAGFATPAAREPRRG